VAAEILAGRASSRFLFVTLMPNALLAIVVGTLLAAGAPSQSPSLSQARDVLGALSIADAIGIASLLIIAAVALHPIQYPLIQLLEGYWHPLPWGPILSEAAARRYERKYFALRAAERQADPSTRTGFAMASAATAGLLWLPDDEVKLLPTSLGNTLRAGEERAGARYGLDISLVIPRLVPLIAPDIRERLADRRNQLDAAARLCVANLVAVVVSVGLLLPTGDWLYVPLLLFAVAWACYRASVAAAQGYCVEMAAAVDLYHRQLWHALALQPPLNLKQERDRAEIINAYLRGEEIGDNAARSITWTDSATRRQ
jgi:hypothetical protein